MANQQLIEYVKGEIGKGTNNEDIKNALLQNGWSDGDIDEVFSMLQAPVSSVPVAPPSSIQASASTTAQTSDTIIDSTLLNKKMRLHPKAVWLFFLKQLATWVFVGVVIFSQFVIGFLGGKIPPSINTILIWLVVLIIAMIILAYIIAKLSYHFYQYELTEHEYKAERGIIWKRYISIPYARIQNVDIYRGILSRILGLSDLQIQTAGQSSVGSEGNLPALGMEHAELIRDALMIKARTARGGGI